MLAIGPAKFNKFKACENVHKYTILQIWEAVDNPQGYLTRTGLYKALALTALAQQGKAINDKILESYSDQGNLSQ